MSSFDYNAVNLNNSSDSHLSHDMSTKVTDILIGSSTTSQTSSKGKLTSSSNLSKLLSGGIKSSSLTSSSVNSSNPTKSTSQLGLLGLSSNLVHKRKDERLLKSTFSAVHSAESVVMSTSVEILEELPPLFMIESVDEFERIFSRDLNALSDENVNVRLVSLRKILWSIAGGDQVEDGEDSHSSESTSQYGRVPSWATPALVKSSSSTIDRAAGPFAVSAVLRETNVLVALQKSDNLELQSAENQSSISIDPAYTNLRKDMIEVSPFARSILEDISGGSTNVPEVGAGSSLGRLGNDVGGIISPTASCSSSSLLLAERMGRSGVFFRFFADPGAAEGSFFVPSETNCSGDLKAISGQELRQRHLRAAAICEEPLVRALLRILRFDAAERMRATALAALHSLGTLLPAANIAVNLLPQLLQRAAGDWSLDPELQLWAPSASVFRAHHRGRVTRNIGILLLDGVVDDGEVELVNNVVESGAWTRAALATTIYLLLTRLLRLGSVALLRPFALELGAAIHALAQDPDPEVSPFGLALLVQAFGSPQLAELLGIGALATARSICRSLRARIARVRIQTLDALEAAILRCIDPAKQRSFCLEVVFFLSAFQDPNTVPVAAFYAPSTQKNVTYSSTSSSSSASSSKTRGYSLVHAAGENHDLAINYMAALGDDSSAPVRLRTCAFLGTVLSAAIDRHEFLPRLFVYLLSYVADPVAEVRQAALRQLQPLGRLYELENSKEVLERKQLGLDAGIVLDSSLPRLFGLPPWPLGQRQLVAAQAHSFLHGLAVDFSRLHLAQFSQNAGSSAGGNTQLRALLLLLLVMAHAEHRVTNEANLIARGLVELWQSADDRPLFSRNLFLNDFPSSFSTHSTRLDAAADSASDELDKVAWKDSFSAYVAAVARLLARYVPLDAFLSPLLQFMPYMQNDRLSSISDVQADRSHSESLKIAPGEDVQRGSQISGLLDSSAKKISSLGLTGVVTVGFARSAAPMDLQLSSLLFLGLAVPDMEPLRSKSRGRLATLLEQVLADPLISSVVQNAADSGKLAFKPLLVDTTASYVLSKSSRQSRRFSYSLRALASNTPTLRRLCTHDAIQKYVKFVDSASAKEAAVADSKETEISLEGILLEHILKLELIPTVSSISLPTQGLQNVKMPRKQRLSQLELDQRAPSAHTRARAALLLAVHALAAASVARRPLAAIAHDAVTAEGGAVSGRHAAVAEIGDFSQDPKTVLGVVSLFLHYFGMLCHEIEAEWASAAAKHDGSLSSLGISSPMERLNSMKNSGSCLGRLLDAFCDITALERPETAALQLLLRLSPFYTVVSSTEGVNSSPKSEFDMNAFCAGFFYSDPAVPLPPHPDSCECTLSSLVPSNGAISTSPERSSIHQFSSMNSVQRALLLRRESTLHASLCPLSYIPLLGVLSTAFFRLHSLTPGSVERRLCPSLVPVNFGQLVDALQPQLLLSAAEAYPCDPLFRPSSAPHLLLRGFLFFTHSDVDDVQLSPSLPSILSVVADVGRSLRDGLRAERDARLLSLGLLEFSHLVDLVCWRFGKMEAMALFVNELINEIFLENRTAAFTGFFDESVEALKNKEENISYAQSTAWQSELHPLSIVCAKSQDLFIQQYQLHLLQLLAVILNAAPMGSIIAETRTLLLSSMLSVLAVSQAHVDHPTASTDLCVEVDRALAVIQVMAALCSHYTEKTATDLTTSVDMEEAFGWVVAVASAAKIRFSLHSRGLLGPQLALNCINLLDEHQQICSIFVAPESALSDSNDEVTVRSTALSAPVLDIFASRVSSGAQEALDTAISALVHSVPLDLNVVRSSDSQKQLQMRTKLISLLAELSATAPSTIDGGVPVHDLLLDVIQKDCVHSRRNCTQWKESAEEFLRIEQFKHFEERFYEYKKYLLSVSSENLVSDESDLQNSTDEMRRKYYKLILEFHELKEDHLHFAKEQVNHVINHTEFMILHNKFFE